jgi:hypothetical protein
MSSGDIRQLTNQAGQLANDIQQIGRVLRNSGGTQQEIQSLDEITRALRQLSDAGKYGNPDGLQQLSQSALEKMRTLDWNIRKRLDTTSDQLYLSGAETVPPNFQSAVSDYFKKLGQTKGKGGGK